MPTHFQIGRSQLYDTVENERIPCHLHVRSLPALPQVRSNDARWKTAPDGNEASHACNASHKRVLIRCTYCNHNVNFELY